MNARPVGRWDPRYWAQRANKYYEGEIKSDRLVLYPPKLRRIAIVEFVHEHGKRDKVRCTTRAKIWDQANRLTELVPTYLDTPQKVTRTPYIRRIWQVGWQQTFGSYGRMGFYCTSEWERLVMAKAALEALNYHYARYLMTRETAAEGL